MTKKIKQIEKKTISKLIFLILVIVSLASGYATWATHNSSLSRQKGYRFPNHTIPYVDGNAATEQVANFYRQYINPNTPSTNLKMLVEGYGSKNLTFYYTYYQHGFDPITCSMIMPSKVTTSLVSTGPTAVVNAVAEYPDSSRSTIVATVVLSDGMEIDSITCPNEKGNLPPTNVR